MQRNTVFFVGLMSLLFVRVFTFGQLYISEIIILFFLLLANFRSKRNLLGKLSGGEEISRFKLFLIGALFSQVMTDIWVGSSITNLIRGFSLILFTIIDLIGIIRISRLEIRILRVLICGYGFSTFLALLLQPNVYFESHPWKFGFAYAVSLLLVLFLDHRYRLKRLLPTAILFIFSLLNFYLGARSLGLVVLVTGLVYLFSPVLLIGKGRALLILGFILCLLLLSLQAYSNLVGNGTFGQSKQAEFQQQSTSKFGLIGGGRSDFFSAVAFIRESPIIGHGSYAAVTDINRSKVIDAIGQVNPGIFQTSSSFGIGQQIPAHSIILQFWLWFGAIATLPWLWFLFTCIRYLYSSLHKYAEGSLLPIYLSCLCIWDLIFSPYGADRKFSMPLYFVIILTSLRRKELNNVD